MALPSQHNIFSKFTRGDLCPVLPCPLQSMQDHDNRSHQWVHTGEFLGTTCRGCDPFISNRSALLRLFLCPSCQTYILTRGQRDLGPMHEIPDIPQYVCELTQCYHGEYIKASAAKQKPSVQWLSSFWVNFVHAEALSEWHHCKVFKTHNNNHLKEMF
jgi:hypothetical protein